MKKNINARLNTVLLLLIIILSGWLYRSSFSSYFFQDDWFTLRISQAETIGDFLAFFIPRTDVIYYRPLGMQLPFFILQTIFGVNPFPFHVLTFVTHAVNIVLVFVLVRMLTKKDFVALLVSFLYGTSSVHYIPLFWSSTYPFVLGPTMFFLAFIFFLLFLKKGGKYYILSLILFLLGLLTNEMVVFLPAILFIYILMFNSMKFFKLLIPLMFIAGILFLFRFILFLPPVSGVYQLEVNRTLLSDIKAYFLWSFNWPEEMKAQFISFFTVNKQFVTDFSNYFVVFVASFFISCFSFYILPGILIFGKYLTADKRLFLSILFGFLWFLIGLLSVIFFPKHTFSYYLPISLVGLLLSSVSLIAKFYETIYQRKKIRPLFFVLLSILCINWLWVSLTTIDFNSKVHWASRRAKIAKELVNWAREKYLANGELVLYIPETSENKLALNDQEAFRILFGTDEIETIYIKDREKIL